MHNAPPDLKLPTQPSIDPDIEAVARVKPSIWAYIILVVVTVSGWGWSTLANSRTNDKQDIQIEKKVDEVAANRQYDAIIKRLDELHEDVREIRRAQQGGYPESNLRGGSRSNTDTYDDRNK